MDKQMPLLWNLYEITCPFSNSNGYTVEVWEWINKFIPHPNGDSGYRAIGRTGWLLQDSNVKSMAVMLRVDLKNYMHSHRIH